MNSLREYAVVIVVSAILIAGALTLPLDFSHQSADARNVKVKSVKNTIKNKIQAITRAVGTANDGISSDGSLAPVPMVTQVLARMALQVPKEAEALLLLSRELMVLVIRQEPVELQDWRCWRSPRNWMCWRQL